MQRQRCRRRCCQLVLLACCQKPGRRHGVHRSDSTWPRGRSTAGRRTAGTPSRQGELREVRRWLCRLIDVRLLRHDLQSLYARRRRHRGPAPWEDEVHPPPTMRRRLRAGTRGQGFPGGRSGPVATYRPRGHPQLVRHGRQRHAELGLALQAAPGPRTAAPSGGCAAAPQRRRAEPRRARRRAAAAGACARPVRRPSGPWLRGRGARATRAAPRGRAEGEKERRMRRVGGLGDPATLSGPARNEVAHARWQVGSPQRAGKTPPGVAPTAALNAPCARGNARARYSANRKRPLAEL